MIALVGRGGWFERELGGSDLRVYAAPRRGGRRSLRRAVAAGVDQRRRVDVASVHLFVLVAALVAAAAASVALALLMRRALAPLGRLTRAAADIEQTGDARRRLPEPGSSDEIGRLAATLNGMLSALERARDAERRFLADASHELRTPLTALVGNVDYLARHGASAGLVEELRADAGSHGLPTTFSPSRPGPRSSDGSSGSTSSREAGDELVAPGPVAVRGAEALERAPRTW